jgi:hypothetical protein
MLRRACVVNDELKVDERRNHRPVGSLHDLGRGPYLVSSSPHTGNHVFYARRRTDLLRIGLELTCKADELLTRREQPHDIVVDSVDTASHLIEIGFSSRHETTVRARRSSTR